MYTHGQAFDPARTVCAGLLTGATVNQRNNGMDILMVGCGWVCTHMAARLMNGGHRIWATCTSEGKVRKLKEKGITATVADFDRRDAVGELGRTVFDTAVISVPVTRKDTKEAVQQRFSRLAGFLRCISIKQSFFFGSVGIYPDVSAVITETTFTDDRLDPKLLSGEQALRTVYPDLNVLRLGGLFGFDRVMAKYFAGKPCQIGYQPANFVHVDDVCRIVETMISAGSEGETYNVVAPEHPLKKEVIAASAAKYGFGLPSAFTETDRTEKVVSSDRLVTDLTYSFTYPSPLMF